MKISKRSLLSVIALVLTISITAFGTVAYMTDSDTVTNTFTVGNINIIVDEKNVDGIPDENNNIVPERDQANQYELIPGLVHEKDPRVTIPMGSEKCYVRMRVEMTGASALKSINSALTDVELLTQFVTINSDWTLTGEPVLNGDVLCYEFRYKEAVDASTEAKVLQPLFDTFTVPITFNSNDLAAMVAANFKLDVHGDAVQTEAFNDANGAWDAYDYQVFGTEPAVTEEASNTPESTPTPTPGPSDAAPSPRSE